LLAPDRDGVLLAWPEFTPDGRSLLFTRMPAGSTDAAEIILLDLKSLKSKVVARGAGAHYVRDGYLVYATGRGLEAIAFSPDTGASSGDAVLIPDTDVKMAADNGAAEFAVSANGTLVQMPPVTTPLAQLLWVDSRGHEEAIKTIAPAGYDYPRLSPDGKRIAVGIQGPNRDVYVLDLERGSRVRISEGPGEDLLPIWSSDGRRLYYASNRGGFHVYSRPADGTGSEELLIDNPDVQMTQWLAPGNRLLFFKAPYEAGDIGAVNLDHPTSIEWVLHTQYSERSPAVSPDGNWIAYDSNEGGQNGIWVRPYPDTEKGKTPIGPGLHPRWSPRGNELYYRNPEGGMMAVPIEFTPEFHAGNAHLLFPNNHYSVAGAVEYDVAPDGRFLIPQRVGDPGSSQIMISLTINWLSELKSLLRH
jgi:Tol biopolymer transport system component